MRNIKQNIIPFNNKDFKKLSLFINENLVDSLSLDTSLLEIKKLALFIEDNLASFSKTLLFEIVIDNEILKNILETIVNNIDDINNLEDIIDNDIALFLVKAFLMQKGYIEYDLEDIKDIVDFDYYSKNDCFDNLISFEKVFLTNDNVKNLFAKKRTKEEEFLLFCKYFYLVDNYAKYFAKGNIPYNDLIQEGSIYLLEAIKNYDINKIPFYKYANIYVCGKIKRYIQNNGNYNHFTISMQQKIGCLKKVIDELEANGKEWNLEKLANILKMSIEEVKEIIPFLDNQIINYDTFINEDNLPYSLTSLSDIPLEEKIIKIPDIYTLKEDLDLTDVETEVLILKSGYNGKKYTVNEICKKFNVSRERIYQIINKIKWKFIQNPKACQLVDFLDYPDYALDLIKKSKTVKDSFIQSHFSPINYFINSTIKSKTLFDLLEAHPIEINIILNHLNQTELKIIYLRFGSTLHDNNQLSEMENYILYNNIYLKMLNILNTMRINILNVKELSPLLDLNLLEEINITLYKEIYDKLDKNYLDIYFSIYEQEILFYLLKLNVDIKTIKTNLFVSESDINVALTKYINICKMLSQENLFLKDEEVKKRKFTI